MTTGEANEIARQALLKIIVKRLQNGVRRRYGVGLSPNNLWRNVHRRRE